jgi:uncharacterized protein YneF (UPF0154 family)
MKNPTIILTDPRKMREAISKQPRVSREHMLHSILAQNGRVSSPPPVRLS